MVSVVATSCTSRTAIRLSIVVLGEGSESQRIGWRHTLTTLEMFAVDTNGLSAHPILTHSSGAENKSSAVSNGSYCCAAMTIRATTSKRFLSPPSVGPWVLFAIDNSSLALPAGPTKSPQVKSTICALRTCSNEREKHDCLQSTPLALRADNLMLSMVP